jgi:hypothetical protein
MRDFKGMKRQRGRNNRGGTGSGGKPQQHNANRAFDSNGPEGVKVRGAAQGVYEKYQQLARDATSSGDRVLAENYLQHAEHYFRVLRAIQPNRPVSDIIGKDAYSAYEIDFEAEPEEQPEAPEAVQTEASAEGEAGEGGQGQGQGGESRRDRFENRQRDDRPREDRQRDDRPRDNNQNRDRFDGQNNQGGQGQGQSRRDRWRDRDDRPRDDNRPREDRPRDDRPRDDRQRDERPRDERPREERAPREDRFRDERPREDRPREDRAARDDRPREERPAAVETAEAAPTETRRERPRRERAPRDRDPMAVIEPQATPLTSEASASPLLRGQDGDVSHAPAFLGRKAPRAESAPDTGPVSTSSVLAAEAEAAPAKPKRRRAPRSFEGAAPESEEA